MTTSPPPERSTDPIVAWPETPAEPRVASRPKVSAARWAGAIAVGVLASVVASAVLQAIGLPDTAALFGGLAVGGLVCGSLTRRRGALQWAVAVAAVFAAQFVLGVVLVLLLYRSL